MVYSILIFSFFFSNESQHNNLYIHFIHTWAAIPCTTSRYVHPGLVLGLDWALPQLTPILYPPCLSWPTQQLVICPNDFYFTLHPPLTTRWLNTFIQVNIIFFSLIRLFSFLHILRTMFSRHEIFYGLQVLQTLFYFMRDKGYM